MNRRYFLKSALLGSAVLSSQSGLLFADNFADHETTAEPPEFRIHRDGTFDIRIKDTGFYHCYPGLERRRVSPLRVTVLSDGPVQRIVYDMAEGQIVLELHTRGTDRFFKQGMGFAGPSGIFDLPIPKSRIEQARLKSDVWSYDSYLVSGVLSPDDHTLILAAMDQDNFLHKSVFYNKQSRFGLIDRHLNENRICFDTGFYLEGVTPVQDERVLPNLVFRSGKPAYTVFRGMARRLEHHHIRLNQSPKYYYCSWYEFEKEFSREKLDELLRGLKNMQNVPLQAVQIDDGYCHYGDWLGSNEKWPQGMQSAFQAIRQAGYAAGIWVAPFMVSSRSRLYEYVSGKPGGSVFEQCTLAE
ncbi:MAG: alpha-galactosidase [candidate division KSB1 bacterium]|nr:alpha-galactosidase [candidate division KSB1 bacterium]